MDTSSIELLGSVVDRLEIVGADLKVHFSRAYILQTLAGSLERTRWWQAGELILEGVSLEGGLPSGPLVCAGGEVGESIYTYRDMIPLPLNSRGYVRCELRFVGDQAPVVAVGRAMRLVMQDVPRYIEHLRPA